MFGASQSVLLLLIWFIDLSNENTRLCEEPGAAIWNSTVSFRLDVPLEKRELIESVQHVSPASNILSGGKVFLIDF